MCLAIPMKLIECNGDNGTVELNSVRMEVNISLVDDPQPDDYVIIHAGFAIQKLKSEDVLHEFFDNM